MRILAFVGYQASGKSEASKVARSMGISVVMMGDVVREETEKRGLPQDDEHVGEVAKDLRAKEGMDAIAKRCVPRIEKISASLVVVDGIRGSAEVERFRQVFGDKFILVSVECPENIRYERMLGRKRSDAAPDEKFFKMRDERENKFGLGDAMKMADVVIKNTGSIEDFRDRIKELLAVNQKQRRGG
jgi:dephospho-CoA kinase